MFNLRLDYSITDWNLEKLEADVRELFNEAFETAIHDILTNILEDAPAGLPVLTGEAKRGFEQIADKYGVPVDYNPNILEIPKYDKLFKPEDFPDDAVKEEIDTDLGHYRWDMRSETEHFIDNEFNSQPFRNQQKPMPWDLLTTAKQEPLANLRNDLTNIIGKSLRRWKVKVTRKQ